MTPEEQHHRRLTGEQREVHERVVEAGLNKFSAVKAAGTPTDEDKVVEKLKAIHFTVSKTMKPIIEEANKTGLFDNKGTRELLASLYLQQFDTLSKEELVFLLSAMVVEEVMNKI